MKNVLFLLFFNLVSMELLAVEPLLVRTSARPETTSSIPHKQIGIKVPKHLYEELVRRTYLLAGIEERSSFTPYAKAKAIWLNKSVTAKRPELFLSGREFSHFHPDGSLHAHLPPLRAKEAVKAGWAVHHPLAFQRRGWEGLILIYTPQTKDEMEVVFQLIIESYNFITGKKLKTNVQ